MLLQRREGLISREIMVEMVDDATVLFSLDNEYSVSAWNIMESDGSGVKVLQPPPLLRLGVTYGKFIKRMSTGRISKCLPDPHELSIRYRNHLSIPELIP